MKIKNDFVTNSSSTSYLLSLKDSLSRDTFLKAIGVEQESALRNIFNKLYDAIEYDKKDILEIIDDSQKTFESIDEFLSDDGYEQDTINIIKQKIEEGRTVYYGKLSSERFTGVEAFFCMESFLFCDDELYFNGNIGGW